MEFKLGSIKLRKPKKDDVDGLLLKNITISTLEISDFLTIKSHIRKLKLDLG